MGKINSDVSTVGNILVLKIAFPICNLDVYLAVDFKARAIADFIVKSYLQTEKSKLSSLKGVIIKLNSYTRKGEKVEFVYTKDLFKLDTPCLGKQSLPVRRSTGRDYLPGGF